VIEKLSRVYPGFSVDLESACGCQEEERKQFSVGL